MTDTSIALTLNQFDEQAEEIQYNQTLRTGPFNVFRYRDTSVYSIANNPSSLTDFRI
ncbi:hypothetical protein ASPCADRAFT_209123 [Aspergillus carbonarius ITEM 5010]|uniref:Uncharacterized protein n=1 Tax=Aspergillus carbonarius (strain ITEM 5010) TaxID=602072 RepID=A0A1R3RHD8_ASPC5|nr:hypothetical protein ASPCADRAFT_209123 [Aspergillus carbonarius ITEM 5010]